MNKKSEMLLCPYCAGASNVICCALCRDKGEVIKELYEEYKEIFNKNYKALSIERKIALREKYKGL